MPSRTATASDIGRVTEVVSLAFARDPIWGVALARSDGAIDHQVAFWRLFVEGALRYSTVFMLDGGEAAAVWLPPGGTELSDEQWVELDELIDSSLEPGSVVALRELFDQFEANHPPEPTFAYLSLLATHPHHAGRGLGQRLLAENLAHFDGLGLPAYLESTNPANDHRYERAGFRRIGGFEAIIDGAPISMMWRSMGGGP